MRKESLPAGDEIELTFIPRYHLEVAGSSLGSFDESHRFELNFVPEPSQPLALSSGLGLLAVLATRRLADL